MRLQSCAADTVPSLTVSSTMMVSLATLYVSLSTFHVANDADSVMLLT